MDEMWNHGMHVGTTKNKQGRGIGGRRQLGVESNRNGNKQGTYNYKRIERAMIHDKTISKRGRSICTTNGGTVRLSEGGKYII